MFGGSGNTLGMVTGGIRHHALGPRFRIKLADAIKGAAILE
jgi:hypothetical protein